MLFGNLNKVSICLLLAVVLSSCASIDKRLVNAADAEHPGMQVFLAYAEAVNTSEEIDDNVKSFFSKHARTRIETTKGWHRLVYTSSYRALKDGECESITISARSQSKILVSCEGPFVFKSAFGYKSDETMHLRVNVVRSAEGWTIDTSGLTHTMNGGKSVDRSMGLKFK